MSQLETVTTLHPWYSMNRKLKPVVHEPVDLPKALEIARAYLARAGERFEWGEDSIAASHFGFGTESNFISFSVHAADQISYEAEVVHPATGWLRKIFAGVMHDEEDLRTPAEMFERIQQFFALPTGEFVQWQRQQPKA